MKTKSKRKTETEPVIYWYVRAFDGTKSILHQAEYPTGYQSTSPGCEDLEQSKQKWGMPESLCVECGQVFSTTYCEPYKTILLRDSICFGCNHWRDMLKHCGNPNQVIVSGHHFLICKETDEPSRMKGHGGSLFKIQFNDGRKAESRNLWCQGDIPNHFKTRLPDNATFIQ